MTDDLAKSGQILLDYYDAEIESEWNRCLRRAIDIHQLLIHYSGPPQNDMGMFDDEFGDLTIRLRSLIFNRGSLHREFFVRPLEVLKE